LNLCADRFCSRADSSPIHLNSRTMRAVKRRFLVATSALLLSFLVSCATSSSADVTLEGSILAILHGDHLYDVRVVIIAGCALVA
jgi:hypothetical protein